MSQVVAHIIVHRFNQLTLKVFWSTTFVNNRRNYERKNNRSTSSLLRNNLGAAAACSCYNLKEINKGSSKTLVLASKTLQRAKKLKDRLSPWCKTWKGLESVPC